MKTTILSLLITFGLLFNLQAGENQQKPSTVTKTQTTTKKPTTVKKPAAKTTVKKPVAKTTVAPTTVKKDTVPAPKLYCQYITRADFVKKIHDLDKDATNWNYKGDKPCIIDFYTTWCGPCRMLTPILEELAKEYEGRIYIYKVDAEKEKELAAAFQVQAYPTLYFAPMNGNLQVSKGALPKAQLVQIIEEVLLKKQAPAPPALLKRQ